MICMKQFYKNWLRLVALLTFAATASPLYAQDVTITGKVVSAKDNLPLPGVTVTVKETGKKTGTQPDGTYKLVISGTGNTLVFSSTGFKTRELPQPSGSMLNAVLEDDISNLNEVIVVGYGTQKKSDVTGAVASVSKQRLENLPNTNFYQSIQGAVPGVTVSQNSGGAEGNDNSLVIRGKRSISASNTPLIILDGIPYTGGISDINPNDIESINILKDASAAAIYGSRGSNGVILVTTKKGSRGKPAISYDASYGVQKISRLPDLLSPEAFYEFKNTREPGMITLDEQKVFDSKNFPDWVGMATRAGSRMQHTLGVSGGGENSRYYVSASYLDVKGIAVNDNFKRLSNRINLETNITKWLTYGTNTQLSLNTRSGLPAFFGGTDGAYKFNPLTTAFNEDGTQKIYPNPLDTFFGNPLAPTLANNDDETYKIISNNFMQVDLPFIKGLTYRLNTGVEYTNRTQKTYYGRNVKRGFEAQGEYNSVGSIDKNLLVENILNYNRSFGKHNIFVTGLYSYQNNSFNVDSLTASAFPNDVLTYYQANVALIKNPSAAYAKTVLISQMARINYAYNEKYLLTLTGRRDGFSGFGNSKKYSFFPVAAVGWNISNEDFLKDSKLISNLKLRASYGSNGNQAVNPYQTLAKLAERSYVEGAVTQPGYIPTSLDSKLLGWETTTTFNVGFDFGFWKDRLKGTLDVYSARTSDLLLNRLISSTHGVTSVLQNIGETSNKGVDLGLSSVNIQHKDFSWTSEATISMVRNKILNLYGDGKNDTANTWFLGKPIDVNFGLAYGGVFQLNDNIAASPQPTAKPGYAKVIDKNGDGKIDGKDRVIIGSRQPDFIWGFGNTFNYKNFSLYVFMHGVQGTSRPNTLLSDNVNSGVRYNTTRKNWWTPDNPTNEFYANNVSANSATPVSLYESDSFLRVKDISLSYTFSPKLLDQVKLKRLKFYLNARNLFTITKWTGIDPELDAQSGIPLQKEFIFGLNVSL
jgi:TonB-linked SusC/RagA family outer membrane protein